MSRPKSKIRKHIQDHVKAKIQDKEVRSRIMSRPKSRTRKHTWNDVKAKIQDKETNMRQCQGQIQDKKAHLRSYQGKDPGQGSTLEIMLRQRSKTKGQT